MNGKGDKPRFYPDEKYKNTIVKIEAHKNNKIQVQDRSGKLWWVGSNQISASFL